MSVQLQIFEEQTSQELTLSPLEALVKISAFLEAARASEEFEAALSLRQFGSFGNADQEFLYGKMLKELSPQTLAKILRQSSKRLPSLGVIELNGNCLIHRSSFRKTGSEFILSDILQHQSEIGEEYSLSHGAIEKIMSNGLT